MGLAAPVRVSPTGMFGHYDLQNKFELHGLDVLIQNIGCNIPGLETLQFTEECLLALRGRYSLA